MKSMLLFTCLSLSTLAFASVGCSQDTSRPSEVQGTGGDGENEVRASVMDEVVAIEILDQRDRPQDAPADWSRFKATVAATKKVTRILENLGLEKGAAKPTEGAIRCRGTYWLTFYKADGTEAGSADFFCMPEQAVDVPGTLRVGDASYVITATDVEAINAIGNEPRAVGDILFGTDKVAVNRLGEPPIAITDGATITKLLGAVQADEVPDANAPRERCMPQLSLVLSKGDKELASVGLSCGPEATGIVQGSLVTKEPPTFGGIKVDAGIVNDIAGAR